MNLPLWAYFFALLVQTGSSASQKGVARSVAALPLVCCANMLYGFGFWHGLFTRLDPPGARPATEVTVESVPV